jgi:hypothetical protein
VVKGMHIRRANEGLLSKGAHSVVSHQRQPLAISTSLTTEVETLEPCPDPSDGIPDFIGPTKRYQIGLLHKANTAQNT